MAIINMKTILSVLVLFAFLLLTGCTLEEATKDTDLIEVYKYNMRMSPDDKREEGFHKLELPIEKQHMIVDELNKLKKSSPLYSEDGQPLGLKSAYNDTTYKIVVPKKYEIIILQDKPYYGDNLFWYEVTSEDKATEGIYKSTENLKEKIAAIIAKGSV